MSQTHTIETPEAMHALGALIARELRPGMCVFLEGDLGAGKTTFVRGLIHALGHEGLVKSPTYALVESYAVQDYTLHHFDLYRLGSVEELYALGLETYLDGEAVCLFEWPMAFVEALPKPDVHCVFLSDATDVRQVTIHKVTSKGHAHAS